MNSFVINLSLPVDIKVKSQTAFTDTWYLINIEYMMLNVGTENMNATGSHDKVFPGSNFPLREIKGKLYYFDSVTWQMLDDNVQREYFDYVADKELINVD